VRKLPQRREQDLAAMRRAGRVVAQMHQAIREVAAPGVTTGHLDVALRAAKLFDEVILAVYRGSDKPTALFTHDERMELARHALAAYPNITVASFTGLTVDYARQMEAGTIVRGLRAVSDFEYEFKLAHMNDHLAPDIEVVCLMTSSRHSFIGVK
jgi:pantetheine-phosphate adenylyltransferase